MNSLLCLFQCKNKFCSNTLCTDHIDVLSMCMKNLFDDCQTKAVYEGSMAGINAGKYVRQRKKAAD